MELTGIVKPGSCGTHEFWAFGLRGLESHGAPILEKSSLVNPFSRVLGKQVPQPAAKERGSVKISEHQSKSISPNSGDIPNFYRVVVYPEIKHGRKLADETTKMLYGGEDGMWGMEDA